MSDSGAESTPAPTPKKAKGAGKAKKPKSAPSHPKVSDMVTEAISTLKERGGSSLQAIKKYIGSNFKVDVERLSPFIKKYLKTAVASGTLVQTKGKGATGSFRLSASGGGGSIKGTKSRREATVKKPKPAAKKPAAKPKKPAAKAAKKPAAKPKKPKAAKSPKKPKATKPKSPKPKKAKKPAAKKSGKK